MISKSTMALIATMAKGRGDTPAQPNKPRRMQPTPEQMAKGNFVEEDIVDADRKGGITIGKAYRRKPTFEKIQGLGTEQIKALRYYRKVFDESEISEVKSALDVGPGGGAGGSHAAITRLEAKAFGGYQLKAIERCIAGGLLQTLRDVALHDLSFSEAAMKRFGARHVDYIIVGKGKQKPKSKTKLAPKSGTHRTIIRDEFFAAVGQLVEAVRPYLSTARHGPA